MASTVWGPGNRILVPDFIERQNLKCANNKKNFFRENRRRIARKASGGFRRRRIRFANFCELLIRESHYDSQNYARPRSLATRRVAKYYRHTVLHTVAYSSQQQAENANRSVWEAILDAWL